MTAPTGWPGAPGYPENAERDGWHWVNGRPLLWDQWHKVWQHSDGFECYRTTPARAALQGWNYAGPLHTPAGVAAREAAAKAEGMREAAGIARNACLVPPDGGAPTEAEADMCDLAAAAILAAIEPKEPTT